MKKSSAALDAPSATTNPTVEVSLPSSTPLKLELSNLEPPTSNRKPPTENSQEPLDVSQLGASVIAVKVSGKRASLIASAELLADLASFIYANQSGGTSEEALLLSPNSPILRIDPKETIGKVLFGEKARVFLSELNSMNPKHRTYEATTNVVVNVGNTLAWLTLFGVLPPWYSIFVIPYILQTLQATFLVLNVQLVKLLLCRFDTYFMIYNTVGFFLSMAVLSNDSRSLFWVLTGLTNLWGPLFMDADTDQKKVKLRGCAYVFLSLFGILVLYCPLVFNW